MNEKMKYLLLLLVYIFQLSLSLSLEEEKVRYLICNSGYHLLHLLHILMIVPDLLIVNCEES